MSRRDYSGEGNPHWKGGKEQRACVDCGKLSVPKYPSQFPKLPKLYRCYKCSIIFRSGVYYDPPTARYNCIDCGKLSTEQHISNFSQPKEMYRCLSCSRKGKAHSQETRKKISETRLSIGYPAWSKGKKCPQLAGKNNPNWKGGVSGTLQGVRQSGKYRCWRNAVLSRDNHTCQISGVQNRDGVEAHHIVRFSDLIHKYNITTYEEAMGCIELWDINNGITMLESVHKAYHEIYYP
jgi:hypothetical protein